MTRLAVRAIVWSTLILSWPGSATAAERVALVIGNERYESLSPLANPAADALSIATILRDNGFAVIEQIDATRGELLDAIEEFEDAARTADTALVYYAGHGFELDGENVIAPVDVTFECNPRRVRRDVRLETLLSAMDDTPNKVVILDACRSDPFPLCSRSGVSGTGFRGLERVVTNGLILANSTLSGALAADGEAGAHSPFAHHLITRLQSQPHSLLRDLLDEVAADVSRATRGAQIPEILLRGGAPRVCLAGESCGSDGTRPSEPVFSEADLQRFAAREAAIGLSQGEIAAVQRGLVALGALDGSADGVVGPQTRAAIKSLQARLGEAATGFLTSGLTTNLLDLDALGRRADGLDTTQFRTPYIQFTETPIATTPDFQQALRAFRRAARERDVAYVHGHVAPDFVYERDFGGLLEPGMSGLDQFILAYTIGPEDFSFRGSQIDPQSVINMADPERAWTDLERKFYGESFARKSDLFAEFNVDVPPEEDGVCTASFAAVDEQRSGIGPDEANDILFTSVFPLRSRVSLRAGPSEHAREIYVLSDHAVRSGNGVVVADPFTKEPFEPVVLPDGRVAWAPANQIQHFLSDSLCFRKIGGEWLISNYVGGGD